MLLQERPSSVAASFDFKWKMYLTSSIRQPCFTDWPSPAKSMCISHRLESPTHDPAKQQQPEGWAAASWLCRASNPLGAGISWDGFSWDRQWCILGARPGGCRGRGKQKDPLIWWASGRDKGEQHPPCWCFSPNGDITAKYRGLLLKQEDFSQGQAIF